MADRVARVWSGSAWEQITSPVSVPNAVVYYQATAPTGIATGTVWVDSDDARTYVYNGSTWTAVVTNTYYQSSAPTGVVVGTLWVDSDDAKTYVYNGTIWVALTSPGAVYQASAPAGPSAGQMWVDSDTDVLYVYTGSAWIAPMGIEINARTASYTLVLTDRAKLVEMGVGSANTLTVPPNSSVAYPVGTQIQVVQTGAGQTTLTPGAGVTINGTPGLKLRTQWSSATLIKRATDTWLAMGDLVA